MEKTMILVSVLLLGWTWTLQGVPVQEDADEDQVESTEEPFVALTDVEGLDETLFYATMLNETLFNATLLHTTMLNISLFNATEDCKKAAKTGPCKAYFQRYFYHYSSRSCKPFVYGGCRGNLNNFRNQIECMQKCSPEDE